MQFSMLQKLVNIFQRSIREYRRSQRLRYKIVDANHKQGRVKFICRYLRSNFSLPIGEAAHDVKIVSGLAAPQACWLGIQYGQLLRQNNQSNATQKLSRYTFQLKRNIGRYRINHVDRGGDICFIDRISKLKHTKDPRAIAQSPQFIREFDPVQACYIGILAGMHSLS